jgi:hypothetical protein
MPTWDFNQPGFHGSPYTLDTLLAGSTITQDETLARVFSHKPQIVSLEDDPDVLARGVPGLRHNGTLPGLLYAIDEPITCEDIYPHPRSSMPPGLEWLTRRPLRLRLICPVEVQPGEFLTPEDITELMKRQAE